MNLQEGLESIGVMAFSKTIISNIVIPKSVKHIADRAFCECALLSSVTLQEGLEYLGSYCFDRTNLAKILLPKSIKDVAYDGFIGAGYKRIYMDYQ